MGTGSQGWIAADDCSSQSYADWPDEKNDWPSSSVFGKFHPNWGPIFPESARFWLSPGGGDHGASSGKEKLNRLIERAQGRAALVLVGLLLALGSVYGHPSPHCDFEMEPHDQDICDSCLNSPSTCESYVRLGALLGPHSSLTNDQGNEHLLRELASQRYQLCSWRSPVPCEHVSCLCIPVLRRIRLRRLLVCSL